MNVFWKVTMLVASAVMLSSCCACRKGKNNLPLIGTQWQVVRIMGQDYSFDKDKFVFTFNAGNFSGVGACNRMMGEFTSSTTGALKFQNLASTKMMCPNADLETKLAQILDGATHYEVDGNLLLILSNGEMQAVFQAVGE